MKTFNGKKLKDIRIFNNLSLSDLADKTGLTRQSLSQYENEKITPELSNLERLAEELNVPIEYFSGNSANEIKLSNAYFRSLYSTKKKNRDSQTKSVEFIARIYKYLNKLVSFPELSLPNIDTLLNSLENNNNLNYEFDIIEDISKTIRNAWGLGYAPIPDIQYLLESHGILITSADPHAEKIDAFSQKGIIDGLDVFFISINKGQTKSRAIFDMAHELGHILLHPWDDDIDLHDKDTYNTVERQANKFASAFLLPKETFINDISFYPTNLDYYIRLKDKWKVSIAAMLYRAKELDVLSYNQYVYLIKQYNYRGWKKDKKEPGDVLFNSEDNLFKQSLDLLISHERLSKESFLEDVGTYCSLNLYSNQIEGILNLPSDYLKINKYAKKDIIIELKS